MPKPVPPPLSLALTFLAAPALAAGSHSVTARVSDHAGNAASASRTFQLVIGPSAGSVTLQVAADTFLTGKTPDKEHGRAAALRVAKSGPSRALVSFDLLPLTAALAGGGQLVSAQLEVSIAANANNWGATGRTVGAYAVAVPWSEGAATWDCPVDANLDNSLPLGGFVKLANPQAALAENLIGPDPERLDLAPPPRFASAEQGAELVELYWQARLRDVAFEEYESHPLARAAAADLSRLAAFTGPRAAGGAVTSRTLFRRNTPAGLRGSVLDAPAIRSRRRCWTARRWPRPSGGMARRSCRKRTRRALPPIPHTLRRMR
jgi:hypothetical protein